jgi:hypothetical protein
LLAALALEHADRAASFGIEHRPNHGGFLVALAADSDWIGVVARKDFVLELIIHECRPARTSPLSTKVNSCSSMRSQNCKAAWNGTMTGSAEPNLSWPSTVQNQNRHLRLAGIESSATDSSGCQSKGWNQKLNPSICRVSDGQFSEGGLVWAVESDADRVHHGNSTTTGTGAFADRPAALP